MTKKPGATTRNAAKTARKKTAAVSSKAGRAAVGEKADPVSTPVARGTRRRLETRERLLDAALKLMSSRGMEGVAINEITELADVGFGSFYNHFDSKEAIHTALIDRVFEGFADKLEASNAGHSDPAQIIATSIRHTMRRAASDPVWASFLIREGLSSRALTRGLGRRLLRDIQNGIKSGRFNITDITMCFLAVGGTILTSITAQLELAGEVDAQAKALATMNDALGPIDQRTSTMCLKILGLKHKEAAAISGQALAVQ